MNIFKETLKKIKHQQQILAMLVFALVAAIIWIGASLFTSQQKTEISKDLQRLAKPLTPSINQDVIQRLRQKKVFLESQLHDFPIYMTRQNQGLAEQIVEIGTEPEPTPSPHIQNPSPTPSVNPSPNSSPKISQP
jgi:uncharacterized protein HemX